MQNRWPGRLLAILTLLVLIAGALWHFLHAETRRSAEAQPQIGESDFKYHYAPPVISRPSKEVETEPEREAAGRSKIPREKVEAWLARHNRDATSLLAAFRALQDTNYLNEAATNFPNDPHVELAVLTHDEFPGDRRKWLDLFKASSPSNSLANYLSARDYFKHGQSDAALRELLAANSKSQFDDYAIESRLNSEEVNQFAGQSPLDSARAGLADAIGDELPQLATLKELSSGMQDWQKQLLNAGDTSSVQNLAQTGVMLADELRNSDSGKTIINQLVANAIEARVLAQLDPNTRYDFLGGQTPAEVQQLFKEQKASFKELTQNFGAIYPNLAPEEMAGYIERMKIYSELDAMRWVIRQHPPINP